MIVSLSYNSDNFIQFKKVNWTLIGDVSGHFTRGHVCTEIRNEHELVVASLDREVFWDRYWVDQSRDDS